MNLNLVDENFYCSKPAINPHIQDKSSEYSALAMILHCFPDRALTSLIKYEHPDFISKDYQVGLEVTEADNELHKRVSKEFYKYKHPKENCNIEKNRSIIEQTGARVIDLPESFVSILDFPSYGNNLIVRDLKERITKKENIEYDETKELYLAIVFFDPLGTDSAELITNTLIDFVDSENTKFKRIYVVTSRFCIKFTTSDKSIISQSINILEYHKMRTLGRMTAEGIVDLNSREWIG